MFYTPAMPFNAPGLTLIRFNTIKGILEFVLHHRVISITFIGIDIKRKSFRIIQRTLTSPLSFHNC